MKTWSVVIPMSGKLYVEVEAEDESSAIEKAIDGCTLDNLDDWEPLDNNAWAELIDDDEDVED